MQKLHFCLASPNKGMALDRLRILTAGRRERGEFGCRAWNSGIQLTTDHYPLTPAPDLTATLICALISAQLKGQVGGANSGRSRQNGAGR